MGDTEDRVRQALQDRALEPDPNQLTPKEARRLISGLLLLSRSEAMITMQKSDDEILRKLKQIRDES